jgi:hypothetical protein
MSTASTTVQINKEQFNFSSTITTNIDLEGCSQSGLSYQLHHQMPWPTRRCVEQQARFSNDRTRTMVAMRMSVSMSSTILGKTTEIGTAHDAALAQG